MYSASMTPSPERYEKLGAFYLGREYDLENKALREDLVLYDSRDLVTHGVVLGMTGSGKTGLCLALLEEAAIDGIPVIAIDPKGDIGNALLTFPNLSAEEFRPWISEEEAQRKGLDPDAFAEAQAGLWRKGLADWGQDAARIRTLREKTDMAIYTPGSSAGLPVSILGSLDCPPPAVLDDAELLAERLESTASSLLGLIGIEADPVQSPEHILLCQLFAHHWRAGRGLTLADLVREIQQPPLRTIGVVDLESFLPEAKRSALAMRLNSLLASPGFAAWLEGEPLDLQRLMYSSDGRPRVSIFNIAHLGDAERMFFVSLLLNQLLGWMRTQQGTTSLRALFYMDEIFGYLPPSAMPPSKKPMMTLLKQARAFGLGLLLATQNPVDLDYKALSNIGTWWIGRLQTERDKARLLDGLAAATGGFDRKQLEDTIAGLGNRVFLMHNVHEDGPVVFHVRWILSYLSGPLARDQIRRLMEPRRTAAAAAPAVAEDHGFLPPSASAAPATGSALKPTLPEGAAERFLPTDLDPAGLCYVPALLRSAVVGFEDARRKISGNARVTLVHPIEGDRVLWDQFIDLPRHADPAAWATQPVAGARFAELPAAALKAATYTAIARDLVDWVHAHHREEVHFSPALGLASNPGESAADFRIRVGQAAREARDAAVEELRAKTAKAVKTLEDRAARAQAKVDAQQAQATSAKVATAVSIGRSLLGAFLGRKSSAASFLRAGTVTGATRVMRESQDVAAAQAELARVHEDLQALERQLETDTAALATRFDPAALDLETLRLAPTKAHIRADVVGILWMAGEQRG